MRRRPLPWSFIQKSAWAPAFATSFSSRPGIASTDFTRKSSGMEEITSGNRSSSSSKVRPIFIPSQHHLPNSKRMSQSSPECLTVERLPSSFFSTVRTQWKVRPLSLAACRIDLLGLWVNIFSTACTTPELLELEGRPLLWASVTDPVAISFAWQFLIVLSLTWACLPLMVLHHLWTWTIDLQTS